MEAHPARTGVWAGETFRQELLGQARAAAGESRVAKLKIEAEEQNEFNLE